MSEGGTYLCGWSYERGGFRLWVEEDRSIEVWSDDFDAAADDLAALVGGRRGDGEAVLEFAAGRPGDGGPGVLATHRNLGYNESVRGLDRDATQYEGGICGHCGFGIGARTKVPLRVDALPAGDIAGVDGTLPWAILVSERFVGLLSEEERGRIRTLPVDAPDDTRDFYEVVGVAMTKVVGVAGAEYAEAFNQSWRCRACSRQTMTIDHAEYPNFSGFLQGSGVPFPPPSVFVFDEGNRLAIALAADRWKELAGSAGTKGISTSPVLTLIDSVVEPEPELPLPEDFDWVL